MKKTKVGIAYQMQSSIQKRVIMGWVMICFYFPAFSQQLTQNIRGTVTDQASGTPIAYATVLLEDIPGKGAVTDSLGNFLLPGVPLGRHIVKASFIGYAPGLNRDLDFTKAHHLMLIFDFMLSDDLKLVIEPYYQQLFDVPVRSDDSYSVFNRTDFYVEDALVNTGKGRNIGVDLTLEKYLSRVFYYLFTGSFFNSRYCGGDGVWHNSRFNRHYILNLLGGKEWMMGRSKQNLLSINGIDNSYRDSFFEEFVTRKRKS